MSPTLLLVCVALYTVVLFAVTWFTSRGATNETYFVGNRSSRWYLVAYGMIGASLSGVTFMSVPGDVGTTQFAYFQMVLGYLLGYAVIAFILLPLYYRLNLTSIYTYLQQRLGNISYKTGASFFMLSRVVGASFRLFIVVNVLQLLIFQRMGVPFGVTAAVFVLLILLYTYQGGVKTIVWTDTLQTTFMLLSLILSVVLIAHELGYSAGDVIRKVIASPDSKLFVTDWHEKFFFPKHFFGGMFIAIAMTGLDQEMMQKNISCRNVKEAQKNMITFSVVLVVVNLLFLCLGVLLLQYVHAKDMHPVLKTTDDLFPTIALGLGTVSSLFFIIGLISAAYPSADGALTALTASFCIDILGFNDPKKQHSEEQKTRMRKYVHIGFAALLLVVVIIFKLVNDEAVVKKLFKFANYTYGPLLGLYAFGLFTKRGVQDMIVPVVCIAAPVICYILDTHSKEWFSGYAFGNELLIVNGLLTFIGIYGISHRRVDVLRTP